MFILTRGFILSIAMGILSFPAYGEEVSKKQIKNLDEQVQEIKAETISLGTQMRLLEEKLLYPSSTQVAVFVSLDGAAKFRPDSIAIQLDDKLVAQHLYTPREFEALQKGGVQRIFAGNIGTGKHELRVVVRGKTPNGSAVNGTEQFKFSKDVGPKVLEVRLAEADTRMITLRDW